ncbi:unnamed protein product [Peniophora sp. CBMAI 1063]|nr:unnamed protein product [Peniophora sp. CBMAI 1063]
MTALQSFHKDRALAEYFPVKTRVLSRNLDAHGHRAQERRITSGRWCALHFAVFRFAANSYGTLSVAVRNFEEHAVFIQKGFEVVGGRVTDKELALVVYFWTAKQLREHLADNKVINADDVEARLEDVDDKKTWLAPDHTEYVGTKLVQAALTEEEFQERMDLDERVVLHIGDGPNPDLTDNRRPRVFLFVDRQT